VRVICLMDFLTFCLEFVVALQYFFPPVLFCSCFLPPPLSPVPSLLADFPSTFGKCGNKGQSTNGNSCNCAGPGCVRQSPPFSAPSPRHGARLAVCVGVLRWARALRGPGLALPGGKQPSKETPGQTCQLAHGFGKETVKNSEV